MPNFPPTDRWRSDDTFESLARSFQYVFPGNAGAHLSEADAAVIWEAHRNEDGGMPKAVVIDGKIVALVYVPTREGPVGGISIPLRVPPDAHDLQFSRSLSKVFNQDLALCTKSPTSDELWTTLTRSRFVRAIARFLPFNSHPASDWIHAMEASTTLTYEGNHSHHSIIYCKNYSKTVRALGSRVVEFREPLSITDALLGEKWIRAVVDSRRVALIATKRGRGSVRGLVSFSMLPRNLPTHAYAPHESLIYLQAFLTSGDMALVAAPNGDILIILGNGIVFQRTQGRWHYLNYLIAHNVLCSKLSDRLAIAVLRAALDLSFERAGALLCIPDRQDHLAALVSDHASAKRPNRILRESLRGLNITKWNERQVITAAATTDGSTVLSRQGRLLDIACMIAKPSPDRLLHITGSSEGKTFTGARSTAAWNASLYGLALKISEDGPITIYYRGEEVHRLGGGK